jgi:hypothetical protein
LVGRHSDRAAKNAKEVIFAHIRERGQTGEIERFGGVSLDVSNCVRDATGLASGGRHRRTNAIRKGGDDRLDQSSRNLLDVERGRIPSDRLDQREHRDRALACGQHRGGEFVAARSGYGRCDLAEEFRREVERNAAVSGAVLVSALEALAAVPQQ